MMRNLLCSVAAVVFALVAAPTADAARSLNARSLNARSLNARSLNARSLNARSLNARSLNARSLNARSLNGQRLNRRLNVDATKIPHAGMSMTAPGVSLSGVVVAL